ncbi:hypothetical protein QQ045_016018 [Rhodiola kirilowii]
MKLGFSNCFIVKSLGKSGGLAVLWDNDVDLTVRSYSDNNVDVGIKADSSFRLTLFYGDPVASRRRLSWNLLRRLSQFGDDPWIVLGDFNEVLCDEEVRGIRPRQLWQMNNFRGVLEDYGLSDMGFRRFRSRSQITEKEIGRSGQDWTGRWLMGSGEIFILKRRSDICICTPRIIRPLS